MNPPVSVPPEIEHVGEESRPDGVDDKLHVVPEYFDPVTVTAVPGLPTVGLKMSVGAGTVNVAVLASVAAFVATVTA